MRVMRMFIDDALTTTFGVVYGERSMDAIDVRMVDVDRDGNID
jgi:hypothetical protein